MSVFDKVSDAGDTISRAVSLASSKKEYIGKQVVNGFLLLIILICFGCLDFVNMKFHLEYLTSASYWGQVLTKTVAGLCAFNIGINLMWESELRKDQILANAIIEYENLIKYKQSDFEYFVNAIFNRNEKKKAYINKINKQIHYLNRVAKPKDKLLYSSELPKNIENYEERLKELNEKKSANKYCRLRKELEELKTDDYIEKNLDSLTIKYYEVDATSFDLEIDGSVAMRGVKTKGNVNIGRAKATSSTVIGIIGCSMFISSFALEFNGEQFATQMDAFLHYLMKCCEDVAVITWQVIRGMLKTRKIISSELTQPYVGRIKVLKEYLDWRLTTKQPNTKSYELLNSEKEIEMTQEEYEKLSKK